MLFLRLLFLPILKSNENKWKMKWIFFYFTYYKKNIERAPQYFIFSKLVEIGVGPKYMGSKNRKAP